jgi:hypothetical protein
MFFDYTNYFKESWDPQDAPREDPEFPGTFNTCLADNFYHFEIPDASGNPPPRGKGMYDGILTKWVLPPLGLDSSGNQQKFTIRTSNTSYQDAWIDSVLTIKDAADGSVVFSTTGPISDGVGGGERVEEVHLPEGEYLLSFGGGTKEYRCHYAIALPDGTEVIVVARSYPAYAWWWKATIEDMPFKIKSGALLPTEQWIVPGVQGSASWTSDNRFGEEEPPTLFEEVA